MANFSPPAAPNVVKMTTFGGAANDENFVEMTFGCQCFVLHCIKSSAVYFLRRTWGLLLRRAFKVIAAASVTSIAQIRRDISMASSAAPASFWQRCHGNETRQVPQENESLVYICQENSTAGIRTCFTCDFIIFVRNSDFLGHDFEMYSSKTSRLSREQVRRDIISGWLDRKSREYK